MGFGLLVGVPAMLVFLLLGRAALPEFVDAERARPDPASVVYALASILTFIFGVKRLAQQDVDAITALSLAAGLLCGAWFVRRQQLLAAPVIDLGLFRSRAFSLAVVIQLLTVFTFMGTFFFVAQYLQLVVGLTPLRRHQLASAAGSDEAGTGTLAAALAAAARLSGPSAVSAGEDALEAFTRALDVTAAVSSAVMAMLAVVALRLRPLRRSSRD